MISDYVLERNRDETMKVRCRSYQRRLVHELRNFNINDTNPSFNVGQAIDACLDHVHFLIRFFESRYLKGYLMNCTSQDEKWRFVELILEIIENSDYIQKLNLLPQGNVRIKLQQKYEVIKQIISTLAEDNT